MKSPKSAFLGGLHDVHSSYNTGELAGMDLAAHVVYTVEKARDEEGKARMAELSDRLDGLVDVPDAYEVEELHEKEGEKDRMVWEFDKLVDATVENHDVKIEVKDEDKKEEEDYEDPIGKLLNLNLEAEKLIEMTDEEWIVYLESTMNEGIDSYSGWSSIFKYSYYYYYYFLIWCRFRTHMYISKRMRVFIIITIIIFITCFIT
jgi:hypothetical protein